MVAAVTLVPGMTVNAELVEVELICISDGLQSVVVVLLGTKARASMV